MVDGDGDRGLRVRVEGETAPTVRQRIVHTIRLVRNF